MATLSFSFDTGSVPLTRIVDAIAVVHGYSENVQDPAFPNNPTKTIPNPQTKTQFAREIVRKIVIDAVRESELRTAKATAVASVASINLT